ncbi:hypothetical protein RXP21_29015, partial [Pseudomonas aeruginosa]|nr:hypothetical protein [Pseudomonas aeruginosa]
TVSGCSGGTNINANVSLKILSKYFDSNGAYITGGDKTATLGSQSKSGTGFVDLTYQHANYNAGLWVAGNRPSGAVKAKYHYVSSVGGYSPCPASVNDSHDGPDSDWVVW